MQKTKIEWCDYTWNPVKGLCPQACWYCYARAMYKRFKWDPGLRINYIDLNRPMPKKPSRIFVGSTIDLFHPRIEPRWVQYILDRVRFKPQHTFIFLTKNPARYAEFDFPVNCWLGTTITTPTDMGRHKYLIGDNLHFISYEPLINPIPWIPAHVNWIIVGAMTGRGRSKYPVGKSWVTKMVNQAKKLNIPVFLKNNLKGVWGEKLIQEYPHVLKNEGHVLSEAKEKGGRNEPKSLDRRR